MKNAALQGHGVTFLGKNSDSGDEGGRSAAR